MGRGPSGVLGSGAPFAPDAILAVVGLVAHPLFVGALIGLAGRLDVTIAAIATAVALRWLYRRQPDSTFAEQITYARALRVPLGIEQESGI